MNTNPSQLPGTGPSQIPGGQNAPAAFVGAPIPRSPAVIAGGVSHTQIQVAPQVALPIRVTDEMASDEEIDQKWVNKARAIVEHTKADPYTQSNELNKVKAEYLKTRFNKELNAGGKS